MNFDTSETEYDALIVGSGISGGWAAKELCEKGLKVLLVDRGENVTHPIYPTATLDPWQFPHRLRLSRADKEKCYVQSRHYSYRDDNKGWYINDQENPYTEIKRFDWIRGDVVGGRSLLWGRLCYRWSDLDFEANAKDGIAVDWPIRYKDLSHWYDYVESFVGISGARDGIPQLPDGKYLPPFDMNCVENHFKGVIEGRFPGRHVTIGRTANLTRSLGARGECQTRNLCHRGCPYGAYFSSNSATLPAALKTGRLTILPRTLVNRVLYDEHKQRATGIEALDMATGETRDYKARLIFLNAATVATTFILLNSTSNRFPNGLGNSSDQIGRNLMDHHKCQGFSARVEGFEDRYYKGRRPVGIYIPRFRNVNEKTSAFLRGYGIQGGAGREGTGRPVETIGAELKEALSEPGSWTIGFSGYGECLPYQENRITINKSKTDKWGRPTLNIDCEFKENERSMQKDIAVAVTEMMEAAGYKDLKADATMSFPGNANHEMGTARMGTDPRTSVLNSFNQMHDVKNVFITDGSCMTSSSCVNPSLTYMALTARACEYAANLLKRRDL